MTFIVENTPIYGNIDVLSRKSQYFEAMFRSNMRESIEGIVTVPDVTASAFLRLLKYICLDGRIGLEHEGLDEVSREDLYALADMYMLDGLRLLCGGIRTIDQK